MSVEIVRSLVRGNGQYGVYMDSVNRIKMESCQIEEHNSQFAFYSRGTNIAPVLMLQSNTFKNNMLSYGKVVELRMSVQSIQVCTIF